MRIKQRLDKLEARSGNGGHVIVDLRDLTADQAAAAIAQAERQVGKNGKVITIEYAKTWPPDNTTTVFLSNDNPFAIVRTEYLEKL